MVPVTLPAKPALHKHPKPVGPKGGRFIIPALFAGQATAAHEELKNGETEIGETPPEKPALHPQPVGTFIPMLLAGQATARQVLE